MMSRRNSRGIVGGKDKVEDDMASEPENNISPETTEESFEALLDQSMRSPVRFEPGEKIAAVVTQITKEWVFIDVGGKSDGAVVIKEFVDEQGNVSIAEGDMIEVFFLSSRNREMLFTTRLSGGTTGSEHLREAYRSGIPVEGVVEREIKGGFAVKIVGNTRAFCPFSHMGLRRIEDVTPYIGQNLTFKIIAYEKGGRNIIVSHRAVLQEDRDKQKEALTGSLKEGMAVSGEITAIKKFGAFIDIGGIEGLIPISEISWGRVEDITTVLSVGQTVEVAIRKLDWENDKFSFSLKEMQPNPWDQVATRYPEGSLHEGRVCRLASFGAFVTLEPGVDGLIHISELGRGKRINHPKEVVEKNQLIEVKIGKVDEAGKRLSLVPAGGAEDSEVHDYRKHMATAAESVSSSLGTLGDILQAKMDENKAKEK
jgi:small subunit ribosomal protein S1